MSSPGTALENVLYEKKGPIAYVTVNRPKVLNALSQRTWEDLKAAFELARTDPDVRGVILTGAGDKAFIAGADIGELARITAVEAEKSSSYGQEVLNLVENKTTPGFSVEKIQNKIALKVVQNGQITMKDCRVPEENRLQNDKSFRDTALVLRGTRYLVAWESTGCQMGAYEHALRYAQQRLQFGKPIGSFQLVQELLAKMLANVTASQCMVVRLAQLDAEGKMTDAHAALSKAFCTARMRETVSWARELLGGNGIQLDYNVARFFADAEALYSYEGTYQMQTLIVGKAVTGFSAFV